MLPLASISILQENQASHRASLISTADLHQAIMQFLSGSFSPEFYPASHQTYFPWVRLFSGLAENLTDNLGRRSARDTCDNEADKVVAEINSGVLLRTSGCGECEVSPGASINELSIDIIHRFLHSD